MWCHRAPELEEIPEFGLLEKGTELLHAFIKECPEVIQIILNGEHYKTLQEQGNLQVNCISYPSSACSSKNLKWNWQSLVFWRLLDGFKITDHVIYRHSLCEASSRLKRRVFTVASTSRESHHSRQKNETRKQRTLSIGIMSSLIRWRAGSLHS